MTFHTKRRQQFLGESSFVASAAHLQETYSHFASHPVGSGVNELHREALARQTSADAALDLVSLRYTAGEEINSLRGSLDDVVAAYERYGEKIREYEADPGLSVFDFANLDEYPLLLGLVGLCFLLHRRDLLPRIIAMQDGPQKSNGGADALFEELMIHAVGADKRFQSDFVHHLRPYESLFYALTEASPQKQLKELNLYLKRWYKDLAGCAWHDSHKPNESGEQPGYSGYWSFEAGAAVMLLGIEDDSSLHQYLYYPKDLVAWAREHAALSDAEGDTTQRLRLRCEAGEHCPREGHWFTPAKADSRRFFKAGELMPDIGGDYGATIWQWDD